MDAKKRKKELEEKFAAQAAYARIIEAAYKKIGLNPDGSVPDKHIAVTSKGPAEEYLPGLYRRLKSVVVDEDTGAVSGKLVDCDGHGQRHRIIGVAPIPTKAQEENKTQEVPAETDDAGDEHPDKIVRVKYTSGEFAFESFKESDFLDKALEVLRDKGVFTRNFNPPEFAIRKHFVVFDGKAYWA